jgi:hypothetical protein
MRNIKRLLIFPLLLALAGCQGGVFQSSNRVAPSSLRDVPALRLNFRYEADVPAPAVTGQSAPAEEKNAAVQADFDAAREQEILYKTIASPNNQRLLAVYQRLGDAPASYRLDMYSGDGKFIRRATPENMAVDFPDIIVWSPDSTSVAFVAIAREGGLNSLTPLPNQAANANSNANSNANPNANAAVNANVNANADVNAEANAAPVEPAGPTTPTPASAPSVLTFRTEQIYICNSEGLDLKPITQNEGLIYYYFVWSPDSSMLASLAASFQEWRYLQFQADKAGEVFVPLGRPRVVEKNGRERRLDDNLTAAHPVWSPDSAKVAVAFKDQIRIYDAVGDSPTQAAIPLRNQLLISSQAFDRKKNSEDAAAQGGAEPAPAPEANANANANAPAPETQQPTTLPDEKTLVSFQPIINLEWSDEKNLYLQTGYVKEFKNGDGARSSLRWHRLFLSPQPVAVR